MNLVGARRSPRRTTAIVIGGGQAGLATSRELSTRGIDHIVLERGDIANSWRHERWDSLRLLTPNWQACLPGMQYQGDDPHGYMCREQLVRMLDGYAEGCDAPVHTHTPVESVSATADGYRVLTPEGEWHCLAVVLATGPYNRPAIPAVADSLPGSIASLSTFQYRNPEQLAEGGVLVVGASATGVQIAQEIQRSGRPVTLAVGEHVRLPRVYRGHDIEYWMQALGLLDDRFDEVEDLARLRKLPSPQLVGRDDKRTLDLNALRALGVQTVGRVAGLQDSTLQFSGSLANVVKLADLKQQRLLDSIDEWLDCHGWHDDCLPPVKPEPTQLDARPRLTLDLSSGEIQTIIWATGFRPDYSWLDAPVLDRRGRLRHEGGVVSDSPGLYAMGLPFMRRRKSATLFGAGDDARDIGAHLARFVRENARPASIAVC